MDLLNEHLCAWNKVTVIKPGMKSADPKQQYYHAKFERPLTFLNTVQEKSDIKVSVKSVS